MSVNMINIPFVNTSRKALERINEKSRVLHTNPIAELLKARVVSSDLEDILKNVEIQNIGIAPFYNTLDDRIVINYKNRVVGNIPVDYSRVLNMDLTESEAGNTVLRFINRIDDSRINNKRPETLFEALQKILFWDSLLWQTGHRLVGLGRLDKVLADYPVEDDSFELICSFLENLHCCYSYKSSSMLGDTGQIILLGGSNVDGSYYCNDYTSLFLKALMKVNLPDPKILLRVSAGMPKDLLGLAVDCMSKGIGSPLLSNDDVIIPLLKDFGYEESDAANYGVSACWEPLSIGNSLEQNNLADLEYGRCINETITDEQFIKCQSFESVLELFESKVQENCDRIKKSLDMIIWQEDPLLSYSLGLNGDISEGKAKYNDYGVLSVGLSAAVDSLLNIKEGVFNRKEYGLIDVQNTIKSNYKAGITENVHCSKEFGMDDDEVIRLANLIIHATERNFEGYRNSLGGKIKFGLSSPNYISSSKSTGATFDGRRAGQPFATHISRDKGSAITEIVNFESHLEFSGVSSNANVIDIMMQQSFMTDNRDKFVQFFYGAINQGLFQLQMNVLSYEQLLDAKLHPEKYTGLIVRVWGFSAYFNDLPEEYKDNLINRAKQMEMNM